MAASREETDGETKDQPGGLGSASAGSAAQLGCLNDQKDIQHVSKAVTTQNSNARYSKSQHLPPAQAQGSSTQQSKAPTETKVETLKATISGELSVSCPDPPVTKTTLSELDVPRIVFNPKLRHDVNFDPDLHFRPNLDGESGRRKKQKANDFWDLLQRQLAEFMHGPVAFERALAGKDWCLPSTLRAIAEILSTLVPPEDRSSVEEVLNVEYLMQQLRKGVADLEKLASWLSSTLKSHCAPMRDEWVDDMCKYLSKGNSNRDVAMIVKGLQTLLSVLEAMKLDVANHQIRCLRPLLIQDTVEFEQTFFLKKIASRKIDVGAALAWFQSAKSSLQDAQAQAGDLTGDSWAFFSGLANLLLPSKISTKIPDTFMFDEERILKLRSDMLDAINLDTCICLFHRIRDAERGNRQPIASPGPCPRVDGRSIAQIQNLPIRKRSSRITASKAEGEDTETGSSRSSSFSSSTSRISVSPLPRAMASPSGQGDENLRQSILDVINDVPGNNRWQQSCPNIALQLARSSSLENVLAFESQLKESISNPKSQHFLDSESNVLAELIPSLSNVANRYNLLTSKQLFEVATSPRPVPGNLPKPRNGLADVAKHLAHIGILHWRVWGQLVYLVDLDAETSGQRTGNPASDVAGREPRNASQTCGADAKFPNVRPSEFGINTT